MNNSAIRLFDVHASLGPTIMGSDAFVGADELRAELQRFDIAGAMVRWGAPAESADIAYDNQRLYRSLSDYPEMLPCPIVAPSAGSELSAENKQIEDAIAHRATAAWIRPGPDAWDPDPWCADPLFHALENHRLPVFCTVEHVPFRIAADIARRFPKLPLIITGASYRDMRTVAALLRSFPNIHLSIATPWNPHAGLEHLVAANGVRQLLFAGGFPDFPPSASVGYLMYARISDAEKQLIGWENFQRLAAGIIT